MAATIEARLKRSLARFKERIQNGSYYEAQQTMRAIINRYVHAENYEAAVELLYQSYMILTEYQKYDEATDLYLYLLEVFELENKPVDQFEKVDLIKLVNFLNALPDTDANVANLASETFKFACKKCGNGVGFPSLNKVIGEKLYYSGDAKEVNQSQQFLFLNEDRESLKLLVDLYFDSYKKSGNPYEFGPFLARLVIPYLMVKNSSFASEGIKMMIDRLTSDDQTLSFTEVKEVEIFEVDEGEEGEREACYKLVNFLGLLVETCQRGSSENGKNFRILFQRYKGVLERFDGIVGMVDGLGREYFGVGVVKKEGNLLQEMMGSLLGGGGGGGAA
ncbi:DEKNAAC102933 [Brettanomyces naardenensis]|uniref:DEKNAAC102933 n=1 Tax=Brettanomyces naardenensis TaxID=13370 RepID=A0A448YLU1_BRENA|nr:DEKNAAC102933 [Brettanomyces naardenensis]